MIIFLILKILALVFTIFALIRLWIHYHFKYWHRKGVPYIKPHPIFGNFAEIFLCKQDPCTHFQRLYNHWEAKDQPVVGLHVMQKPCLLIRDLDLVKSIFIRDFNKFSNRYSSSDPHSDSLGSDNLFFSKNPKWKEIRVKLTPVFTSGKMKQMFPLIEEIGHELDQYLLNLTDGATSKSTIRELKDINALYTTDVIATVAFGVQANSLKDPKSEFRKNGKKVFTFTRYRALEFSSMFFFPALVRLLRFKVFSKETSAFLKNTIKYVMGERVQSGRKRNDLIDVLIKFKQEAETEKDKHHFILERDCLVAQAAIFFTAGFEASSNTMSFSLYELAKNPRLQERLRNEIKENLKRCNGVLTYETIMEMKYLDCVVKEVLRLYPSLPFLDRVCTLDKNEKGYSLRPHLDFDIPNGMPVYVSAYSFHMDPKYFPNPHEFDPDRFAPENKDQVNMNAYMPFGVGPHNCIGDRFGTLQTKVGLINFLRNHYVTPCEQSHKEMKLDPRAIIIQSLGGIYCNIVRDPLIKI